VKDEEETEHQFQERAWREHLNCTPEGFVFVPPMAFKLCFIRAAGLLGLKKVDSRNERWTKHFEEGGIQIPRGLVLPLKRDSEEIRCEWIYAHSQPTRPKQGGRVWRAYPTIDKWKGKLTVLVVADIPKDVVEQVIVYAGPCVGVGRFRPENRGVYGMFEVLKFQWDK